jgi:hypothetical protein
VRTRQVAPTILAALGLDPDELQAVRREGTASLPGLHLAHDDRDGNDRDDRDRRY